MPTLLDKAPNLTRVLHGVSNETRAEIIAELDALYSSGRAAAYERAIKIVGTSRRANAARAELAARAAACRKER
jgi:hypothetical protein